MLLLKRRRQTDAERVHAALSTGIDRELARKLRTLRRNRGSIHELALLGQEAIALARLRHQVRELQVSAPQDLGALSGKLPSAATAGGLAAVRRDRVVVPADILFGLHHRLFPAERMAVIAGRPTQDGLQLTSTFDVTSEQASHVAYTKANPGRLGAALMSMEKSGTRLGAWAHSHPGSGPQASYPSITDRKQYSEWVLNYPRLAAFIMTEDGFVRFWGGATEDRTLSIEVSGAGVERIDDVLYRISR